MPSLDLVLCHAQLCRRLRQIKGVRGALFLDIALGVELFDVGPQVFDFLFVLDAGEDHLGTGDFGPWVLDVFAQRSLRSRRCRNSCWRPNS